ncbi:LuxR C-terminal-related transcriptional regulator [Casimicrobium huifangae]|uniref:helix-turn-helix transcriptional regulator n=1 Tax=Casimicrobium huifangae TaxID=2591109 RepID=UPI0037835DBD
MVQRAGVRDVRFEGPGVIWCRLRSNESVAGVLAAVDRVAGQPLVLLCDEPDETLVMQALALGAAGCCNTHAAPDVLRQVALVVSNGGLWVGQSLLRKLVGATSHRLGQHPPEAKNDGWSALLSEREVQVAKLVAGGSSNREIAEQLAITERTVKAHLTAIFEKLGLRDRLQLSLRINGLKI